MSDLYLLIYNAGLGNETSPQRIEKSIDRTQVKSVRTTTPRLLDRGRNTFQRSAQQLEIQPIPTKQPKDKHLIEQPHPETHLQ
jgi:hypothetical protein